MLVGFHLITLRRNQEVDLGNFVAFTEATNNAGGPKRTGDPLEWLEQETDPAYEEKFPCKFMLCCF